MFFWVIASTKNCGIFFKNKFLFELQIHSLINNSFFFLAPSPRGKRRRLKELHSRLQIILDCKRNFDNLNVVRDQ